MGDADGNQTIVVQTQPFVIGGETQLAHVNSSGVKVSASRWRAGE